MLVGSVIVGQYLAFNHSADKYPFYAMWDMDEFAATELLTINSGLIPRVLIHPGFGMHLLHHLAHIPAHWMGFVSAYDIHDVGTSLNPILVVAELTSFLRQIPAILCLATVLSLWSALMIHFRPSPGMSLVSLLALATPQSFVYQSLTIRFEIYAMFYWSVGVLLIALAAQCRRPFPQWGLIVFAGIMLGLSFLTKVQALYYLFAFPLIAMFLLYTGPVWRREFPRFSRRAALIFLSFTMLGIIAFAAVFVAGMMTKLPEEFFYSRLSTRFGMGYRVLLVAVAIFVFQVWRLRTGNSLGGPAYAASALGSCLFLGFSVAPFCHFLVFVDPRVSLDYLLYESKMTYGKSPYTPAMFDNAASLATNVMYNGMLYGTLAATMGILVAVTVLNWIPKGRTVLMLAAAACGVVLLNLAFGVRFILRDLIWAETLPVFLTVAVLMLVTGTSTRGRAWLRLLAVLLLAGLTIANWRSSRLMLDRFDANYNVYGWKSSKWFGDWWTNKAYDQALHVEDDAARGALFSSARRHREVKRIAEYVFKNVEPDLRGVGVLSEGRPVWRDRPTARIASFPNFLRGALVFDVSWQKTADALFFSRAVHEDDYLQKIVPSPNDRPSATKTDGDWLAVLGRNDIRVFLFIDRSDLARVIESTPNIVAQGPSITLTDGPATSEVWGAEINSYAEIPVGDLGSRYFFVVAPADESASARAASWP